MGDALSNQRSKPLEVRGHLSKRREGSEMRQWERYERGRG